MFKKVRVVDVIHWQWASHPSCSMPPAAEAGRLQSISQTLPEKYWCLSQEDISLRPSLSGYISLEFLALYNSWHLVLKSEHTRMSQWNCYHSELNLLSNLEIAGTRFYCQSSNIHFYPTQPHALVISKYNL